MAKDYGIKVMKEGYPVSNSDIRNILFSSKYTMLKYHSDNTASIVITNGNNSGSTDISHSLGYVPAYIAYDAVDDYNRHIPTQVKTILGVRGKIDSYATSSKITIRLWEANDFGTYSNTMTDVYNDYWNDNNSIIVGNRAGYTASGAIRFTTLGLNKDEAITSAWLNIYVQYKGAGAGQLKINTYGIDEDNTAAFSGSPMGRTSTTAVTNQDVVVPPVGEYLGINVKPQVEEIIARNGWSKYNAIGFKIYDNSTPNNVYIQDYSSSYLRIVKDGSTTFYFRAIIFKDRIDS